MLEKLFLKYKKMFKTPQQKKTYITLLLITITLLNEFPKKIHFNTKVLHLMKC